MLSVAAENPPCIECGLCREVCPVFGILRQEQISPRGLAILADHGIASVLFYQCTLCRACREVCPVGHDPDGERLRAGVVNNGVETEANKEMISNIRRYGNPFGHLEDGEIPKTLTRHTPEELAEVPTLPGSLEEALDALERDHEFLLKGEVFTEDVVRTWIEYKRKNEVDAIRMRPHPYEFALYYDI
jgi:Fe-S oxidoreductase